MSSYSSNTNMMIILKRSIRPLSLFMTLLPLLCYMVDVLSGWQMLHLVLFIVWQISAGLLTAVVLLLEAQVTKMSSTISKASSAAVVPVLHHRGRRRERPSSVTLRSPSRAKKEMNRLADSFQKQIQESGDSPEWRQVIDKGPLIQVYESTMVPNAFKVVAELPNSSGAVFDLFYDICRRPFWDDMCTRADIVEEVDAWTRVIYLQMKAIWPTAPRDLLVVSLVRDLGNGMYLNVARSTIHPKRPEMEGFVRMEARCIGQLIVPISFEQCRVIQIADGDPGGWIPKSVVHFVATIAIPRAFAKIAESVLEDPHKPVSDTMERLRHKSESEPPGPESPENENPAGPEENRLSHELDAALVRLAALNASIERSQGRSSSSGGGSFERLNRIVVLASPYLIIGICVYLALGRALK